MEITSEPPRRPLAAVVALGTATLFAVGALVAAGSTAVWVVPVVLMVGLAAAFVQPGPLDRLALVLGLQVFQLGGEDGLGAGEAVAGLALVGYLVHWYGSTWLAGRPVVTSLFDAAALAWGTVGVAAAAALGLLFGANAFDFRADLLAALPFLLYLPVKDTCAHHRHGPTLLAAVLVCFGLVATLQSVFLFHQVITGATEWWEIADARFASGETSITAGVLICFGALTVIRKPVLRVVALALVGVLFGGLILSKSRAFWVAAALGLLTLGILSRGEGRRRLVAAVVLGATVLTAISLTFFADQVVLLAVGSVNRLFSLATAGQDISLLNRFAETEAAWARIRQNPILGHGWGVQITYYSLISEGTTHWAFLHNGYVALWFKTGLWGLALMAGVWGGAIVRGALAGRLGTISPTDRACALGAVATLVAFSLTAITSNPFSILDQMLVVTLSLALAHGVADRSVWAGANRQ